MKRKQKYESQIRWGMMGCAIVGFYFIVLRWNGVKGHFTTLKNILLPVIIGFAIAFILDSIVEPIVGWLVAIMKTRRHEKLCRTFAICFAEALMIIIISLLISIIIPSLVSSVTSIVSNMDSYIKALEGLLAPVLDKFPQVEEKIYEFITDWQSNLQAFLSDDVLSLLGTVTEQVKNVGSIVYNVILGVIISAYLLAARNRLIGIFKKLLYAYLKVNKANAVVEVMDYSVDTFKRFFVGKLLDSFIIGIICFIVCTVLKMPYAMLVSIVVGVTNIIPYFGPIIGAVPSALLILVVSPWKALLFVGMILVLQQVDGNLIGPRILGNSIGVSTFGVLFSILVGGGLFGVPGMLVAVPVYSVVCMLINRNCTKHLKKKHLPLHSADYLTISGLSKNYWPPVQDDDDDYGLFGSQYDEEDDPEVGELFSVRDEEEEEEEKEQEQEQEKESNEEAQGQANQQEARTQNQGGKSSGSGRKRRRR